VAVRGPVDDIGDVQQIRQLLEPLYGVRRVDTDGLVVRPPPQADIALTGHIRAEVIELDGELTDADQRDRLVDGLEVDFAEVRADDVGVTGVEPLRGDDANRLAGFSALASALRGPDTVEATITIDDGELTTTAVVRTVDQQARAAAEAERYDVGIAITTIGVDVDQVAVDLVIEPDLVLVSGQVLSSDQRLRVLRAAEQAVGLAGVEADIIVVDRPAAFAGEDQRIDVGLGLLDLLVGADITEAVVSISDGQVTAEVEANSLESAAALRDELAGRSVVAAVVVSANPVLPPSRQVEALTAGLADIEATLQEAEEFAPGSDQLLPSARAALADAVALFAAHPDPVVRVVVHTDGRGASSANAGLSLRRADSVVAYLIGVGVEAGRLVAVGAGETELLVDPETTDADYARNRRIEFEVIAP